MKRSDKDAVTFTSRKQRSVAKSRVYGSFLPGFVTLGKLPNLAMPQFLHMSGLLQGFSELYVNCLE